MQIETYGDCNVESSGVLPVFHGKGSFRGVPTVSGGGPRVVGDDQVRGKDPSLRVQCHPGREGRRKEGGREGGEEGREGGREGGREERGRE